ncbi:DUF2116 family Zn-ribbon domain-containing protein [Metabacillus sp. Hm71]
MLCPYCKLTGCEEDCVDFCINCGEPIKADDDFCSASCKKQYKG